MAYYFTSDTHFYHENILDFCDRPFKSVKEMNDKLISNWNSVVNKNDIVFHIGDFSWRYNTRKILPKLNGQIILIQGNHDKTSHSPIIDMTINLGGHNWYLIHNPEYAYGEYNLVGHIHKNWKTKIITDEGGFVRYLINVGADVWDYRPISLKTILKTLREMKRKHKSDE